MSARSARGATQSEPGILVRLNDAAAMAADARDEIDAYSRWHRQFVADQRALPGLRAARRYQVAGGLPSYMTVYECGSLGELSARARGPGQTVSQATQFVCRQTWSVGSGIGGSAIIVQCKPVHGREVAARNFIRDTFVPHCTSALLRMSLWEADAEPADPAQPGAVAPHWLLAMDSYDVARTALAVHAQLLDCESGVTGLRVGSWTRYELISAHATVS